MTQETGLHTRPARTTSATHVGIGVLVAAAASLLVNTAVVTLAAKGIDATAARTGLTVQEYVPTTVLGVLAGTAGWWTVRRTAHHPRAVLRILVPAVVLASFVPDLVVLANGRTLLNVVALLLMHLVVATITVCALVRILPLNDNRD
jgi:H+/Cl- antiporter ClcA